MSEPRVTVALTGSLFVRAMIFEKAGDEHQGHSHTYDHFTLVARGGVRIESNGRSQDVPELELIFIPKDVVHVITALEDNTVVTCLHAVHAKDNPGDILEGTVIPPGTPPWSLAVPITAKEARAQGFDL